MFTIFLRNFQVDYQYASLKGVRTFGIRAGIAGRISALVHSAPVHCFIQCSDTGFRGRDY